MMQLNTDVIANRNIGIVFHDDLAVCDPHSHTFFELAYIIHGNAIHTLDGNSDAVKAGDYVFIEPGSVHSFSKTKDEDKLTVINCIFTPELIFGIVKRYIILNHCYGIGILHFFGGYLSYG